MSPKRQARISIAVKPALVAADSTETILLAVTGMSPAVLTETIWALAHEEKPVIPRRVIMITTTTGRDAIERELMAPNPDFGRASVWDALRNSLEAAGHTVKGCLLPEYQLLRVVNPKTDRYIEMADIRNLKENQAAADFILEQVRNFSEIPGTRIVASIAGGRKTMGALLYACMSLQAREDARLTHVLVNEPYDGALTPKFYFPAQPVQELKTREGQTYAARQACIQLADIPFVPLRNLFERDLVGKPRTFVELVNRCRINVADYAAKTLRLTLSIKTRKVEINETAVEFSIPQFLLLYFLALRARRKGPALLSFKEAIDPLAQFVDEIGAAANPGDFSDWRGDQAVTRLASLENDDQPLRKLLDEIKSKLKKTGREAVLLIPALPVRGRFSLNLAPSQIVIHGDPRAK